MQGPCLLCTHFEMTERESYGCSTCGSISASMRCGLGFWREGTDYTTPKDVRVEMRHGWTCKKFALADDCGPEDVGYLKPDDPK